MELPGVSDRINNARLGPKRGMQGSHRKISAWLELGGFTLYSIFYFHSDLSETEVEVIDLDPH